MTTRSDRSSILLLDEASDGQAFVQLENGDKFFVAVADAARACQAMSKADDFARQFSDLLTRLSDWVKSNRPRIKRAHLSVRSHDILFVVMQKDVPFDQELAESLADLDLEIANDEAFSLIDMEVLAIPLVSDDAAAAFLASENIYTYAK